MAGMIAKGDIEKVRAAADLYDLVSASVTLKPSGTGTFVGLCPFHDEKTPSFSVRPALGVWHCFGCGLGGDVFKYIEQQENIDFREAVEYLADRYHIEIHYESGASRDDAPRSKRARLLEANEEAQRFFVSQITSKEALAARKLLGGRNFTQQDCALFGCGYAPRGWDNLVRYLSNKGFTQQEMIDAGLARAGQRGVYDYFRGRVTWPIRDSTGRTLGFGARKLYDDDTVAAKYINTPDTQLYRKNQVLYGIDIAKEHIVKKRQVVIVEGYTDVMACHLAGIDTAVATCGTAFGSEHAKIVRRLIADDSLGALQLIGPQKVSGQALSSRIVFTFDGDAAGQKAAIHAFGLDSAFLSQTYVAVADNNLDPCDLRLERGDEAVRSLIAHSGPLYDFVIDAAINRFDTSVIPGQVGAMKAAAPLIAQIRDRSMHDMYTRKAARRIGIDLDIMRQEVRRERNRMHIKQEDIVSLRENPSNTVTHGTQISPANKAAMRLRVEHDNVQQGLYKIDDAVFICEQQFMALLVQVPRAINPDWFSQLTIDHFTAPVFRTMFEVIKAAGGLPSADTIQGMWMHMLAKAAGPMMEPVVNQLAVMSLPIFEADSLQNRASQNNDRSVQNPSSPLRPASAGEQQYAMELMVKLLDTGFMRRIAVAKKRMSRIADGQEKIELLGRITQLETARKDLRLQMFG